MKAVEDAFYESKFNLAMKLLQRSHNKETYQVLNNKGQNLFHILGQIKNINNAELPEFLNTLYSKNISLNAKDNFGNTPLHYAAENVFEPLIKFIIDKFGDDKTILDIKNNDDYTPLILAMKGKNIKKIKIFLIYYLLKKI